MRELRGEPVSETYALRVTLPTRHVIEAEARRLGVRPADVTRMALALGLEVLQRARETAGEVADEETSNGST